VICEVVPTSGKKPKPEDFDQCAAEVSGKFFSKEATMSVNNSTLKASDNGTTLVDLHGSEHFDISSLFSDPNTGLPLCTLFADYRPDDGVLTDHAVIGDYNGDGILDVRMQFENSGLGLTTATQFLRLECQAGIVIKNILTDQTITTAAEVTVKNN